MTSDFQSLRPHVALWRRASVPLGLLVAAWIVVTAGEFLRLPSFDAWLTSRSNQWLGRSPTYDLTLAFLTENSGDIFGGLLILALFLRATVWNRAGRSNPGAMAAWIALLSVLLFIGYEIADLLQENIERATPGEAATRFRLLSEMYEVDVDVSDDHSFPAIRAAVYYIPFFLIALRFGRRWAALFWVPLALCLAHVLVGGAWPSDILGGFLLAWLVVAAAFYPPVMEAYMRLEHKAEAWYARRVRRTLARWLAGGLTRDPARRRRVPPAVHREGERGAKQWVLDARLKQMLEKEWGLADIALAGPPHKKRLFRLETAEGTRAFKLSRHEPERREELEAVLETMERVRETGRVRLPRIIPTREGRLVQPFRGDLSYLMEWMEGRPPNVAEMGEMKRLFHLLGTFHAQTAALVEPEKANALKLIEQQVRRLEERVKPMLAGSGGGPAEREAAKLARSMEAVLAETVRSEVITRLASLYALEEENMSIGCLCHGDTHPMNYAVQADGEVAMLDFDRLRPGLGAEDLIGPCRKCLDRYRWEFGCFRDLIDSYAEARVLPKHELVVLLGGIFMPRRSFKLLQRGLKKGGADQALRLRLMRENMLSSAQAPLKRKFIEEAAEHYDVPMVKLAFGPPGSSDFLKSEQLPRAARLG